MIPGMQQGLQLSLVSQQCLSFTLILLSIMIGQANAKPKPTISSDVVIYSATPAGIAAAVAAAREGKTVSLIEPTKMIGGLVTSGLSNTDFRSFESITGFFLEFSQRVQQHYEDTYGKDSSQSKAAFRGTHGEPSVNLMIFREMIEELPNIQVYRQQFLNSVKLSEFNRGRRQILSITCENKQGLPQRFTGKIFIDGSYQGDLLALAGEPYHVGRESRSQYGERFAGDEDGNADGQVQGYNLRLIMTQRPENRRPPYKPDGYNRDDFVDVLKHFERGDVKTVFAADRSGIYRAHEPLLPNGKADVNDTPHAPVRLSMPDINDAYPDAEPIERARIIHEHYRYNLGLLYFLQTDETVPEKIQQEALSWGACKDEFPETDGIPPQLYIREARRLVGQHVFTEHDTTPAPGDARARLITDSIAIGDYVHNCHGTGRIGPRFGGKHTGEFYKQIPPYQIAYGVIVSGRTNNLLVPVACSASHFGFGALRLEPIWSALGQAAGTAASLAIEEKNSVQDVNILVLQRKLHNNKNATIYVADVLPDSPGFAAVQWWGTMGGLHGLEPQKQPRPEHIVGQYNQAFPGHSAKLDQALDETTFKRWQLLAAEQGIWIENVETRGEFIRAAYEQSRQ